MSFNAESGWTKEDIIYTNVELLRRALWVIGTGGRLVVFTGGILLAYSYINSSADAEQSSTDPIGVGLLLWIVQTVVAIVWGASDVLQGIARRPLIVRWVIVGLGAALAVAFGNEINSDFSWTLVILDFFTIGLVELVMVAGAAVGSGLIVGLAAARQRIARHVDRA